MESKKKPIAAITLLITEDDKPALNILTRMIDRKFPDITVYQAENGREGLELFKTRTADIVLTDINMPLMDGIEMAEAIKSIKPGTKFIVLTGYNDRKYLEKFSEIGFSDYMMKPIMFGKLFAAIEKCIDELSPP